VIAVPVLATILHTAPLKIVGANLKKTDKSCIIA